MEPDPRQFATPAWSREAKLFAEAWDAARGSMPLPRRDAFGPAQLKAILPHVAIIDYAGPDALPYRLVGSALVEGAGADPTGRNLLDLVPPARRGLWARRWAAAMARPAGLFAYTHATRDAGVVLPIETLALPVAPLRDDAPMQFFLVSREVEPLSAAMRQWPLDETIRTHTARHFVFVDIGAGLPDPVN